MNTIHSWPLKIVSSIFLLALNLLATPVMIGFGVLISLIIGGITLAVIVIVFPFQEIFRRINLMRAHG